MSIANRIPWPVVQRLPRYLTQVVVLREEGVDWVSSQHLAEDLDLTASTVRQDLSHLDLTGVAKRGFSTRHLEAGLRRELGSDHVHRMVIYGAGHLGSALLMHRQLRRHGFHAMGIFDRDPQRVGRRVGRYVVRPAAILHRVVRSRQVDVGVVAVPAHAAQEAADDLIEAGVRGILNMAYTHLKLPSDIAVVDVRILARLQELAYSLRMLEVIPTKRRKASSTPRKQAGKREP
jgi:redox-sensing transcriptional repressor